MFDADRVFLQLIGLVGERLFDDVAEQFAEATGIREALAGQDAIELGLDVAGGNLHDHSIDPIEPRGAVCNRYSNRN